MTDQEKPSNEQPAADAATGGESPKSPKKRRFWVIGAVTGIVAAVATLGACGHRGGGYWGSHDGDPAARIERIVDKVFSKVDASDEQKQKINAIAAAAIKDLKPMRETFRESRQEAVNLLTDTEIDRMALENLRKSRIGDVEQASTRVTLALADIAEVLTPEQRAQAREKIAKHKGRHHWRKH